MTVFKTTFIGAFGAGLLGALIWASDTAAQSKSNTATTTQATETAAAEEPKTPPTRVAVDAVRTEPLRQTVPVVGRFVARQSGVIAARINGAIGEFNIDVGDRVKEGEVVAVLIKERLTWQHNLQKAEVSNFAAQLKTRKQTIKLLRQELARLESLRKSPAFSQARLDDKKQQVLVAESEASEANAQLSMANANLRLTAISLYDADIRAPFSGVVTKRHADVGTYVNVGSAVVTLIGDQSMEIEADVPSDLIGGLTPKLEVPAIIDGRAVISAMVRAVIPEENPQTRTRAVRFFPMFNTKSAIAVNQSVTLRLPADRARTVLTVHKDAVINRKGKRIVVLAKDGRAQLRTVKLGQATGSRFVVLNGLAAGDVVVVRGNERLLPGTPLAIQGEPTANAKPAPVTPKGNTQ